MNVLFGRTTALLVGWWLLPILVVVGSTWDRLTGTPLTFRDHINIARDVWRDAWRGQL